MMDKKIENRNQFENVEVKMIIEGVVLWEDFDEEKMLKMRRKCWNIK